jgi:hypothetical protein
VSGLAKKFARYARDSAINTGDLLATGAVLGFTLSSAVDVEDEMKAFRQRTAARKAARQKAARKAAREKAGQ